jgi:hypothetical protein
MKGRVGSGSSFKDIVRRYIGNNSKIVYASRNSRTSASSKLRL